MPPLCRETQSLGQQMLNTPLGINGLIQLLVWMNCIVHSFTYLNIQFYIWCLSEKNYIQSTSTIVLLNKISIILHRNLVVTNIHRLSERLPPPGIMETQLRAPLKPSIPYCRDVREVSGGLSLRPIQSRKKQPSPYFTRISLKTNENVRNFYVICLLFNKVFINIT